MRAKASLFMCALLCGVAAMVFPGVASAADIGFPGPAYSAGTGGSPTGWKPESKLWWNDGFWWASMAAKISATNNDYHIFRLNLRAQRWVDTGVTIDTRDSTRQDVLWTGDKLFIASHKFQAPATFSATPTAGDAMRIHRFSYNAAANTYSLDPGFPTQVDNQKSETLVIDRDSTGKLWATWVQQDGSGGAYRVFVNTSSDGGATWSGRFALPGSGSVTSDDISSLIRFDGKIGVMWSDQGASAMMFAVHADGMADTAWTTETAISGPKRAEDHINLKADGAGRVYAAVRTKFSAAANPGTMLLVRDAVTGTWTSHQVTNASFDHTRPIVLLDARRAYVFEVGGGVVYMKSSRLGAIAFSGGAGTPVIRDQSSAAVTNPTSTKQNLNGTTQLIVMASNNSTKRYWHAYRQLRPCINGTAGPNRLVGTAGDDRLCGRGGNDSVRGLGGNDLLVGGSGADQLVGDSGRDTFRAGRGNDTLFARDGRRELVNGGGGRDRARVDGRDIRRSIEALF